MNIAFMKLLLNLVKVTKGLNRLMTCPPDEIVVQDLQVIRFRSYKKQ